MGNNQNNDISSILGRNPNHDISSILGRNPNHDNSSITNHKQNKGIIRWIVGLFVSVAPPLLMYAWAWLFYRNLPDQNNSLNNEATNYWSNGGWLLMSTSVLTSTLLDAYTKHEKPISGKRTFQTISFIWCCICYVIYLAHKSDPLPLQIMFLVSFVAFVINIILAAINKFYINK